MRGSPRKLGAPLALSVGLLAAVAPCSARAMVLRLLDEELRAPALEEVSPPDLAATVLGRLKYSDRSDDGAQQGGGQAQPETAAPEPSPPPAPGEERKPDLSTPEPAPPQNPPDVDLLGSPSQPPPVVDVEGLRLRRTMLNVHQGLGLGLLGLQIGTTVLGQLNYSDHYHGGNTGKYKTPHAVLAYSTLGVFATTGIIALLAPKPVNGDQGFDRVAFHKYAMLAAAAGMVAEGVLGIVTKNREGYQNQKDIATVHLAIGYATLAAVAAGVSALVF